MWLIASDSVLFTLQAGNMICEWAVALTMEGKAASSCISFPPLPLPSPSYPFPPPGYFCGVLSSQSKLREREKEWGEQCRSPYFADLIHTPYSENTACMWVRDPCRFLLFIAISINTGLHTAGFTQCCVSCKRFYLCYGLEVASASSKVKMEMKASSAHAMLTLSQDRLFVELGKHCSGSSRGQGFQCCFCIWCPRDFFPLYVSVHACAWNIGASLCRNWDWWRLCGWERVIPGQTSCICPAKNFQAQSCSLGPLLPLRAPQSWRGIGFLLPAVSTGTCWVGSHSSKCCTPLSVVRQTSAAGMCGMFLWFASSQPCIATHVKYWNAVFLLLLTFKNLGLMWVVKFLNNVGVLFCG